MNILSEILRGVWMIDPLYARQYYPLIHNMLQGDITIDPSLDAVDYNDQRVNQSKLVSKASGSNAVDAYDVFYFPEEITDPSVFVLDIIGPITKYNQFCGPAGMRAKGEWLKAADKHPNIFAHILRIDSGGGEGYACRYFSQVIQSLQKPVFAFVDGMAASAAYWIAASCSHIAVSSDMDRVGSIGTYITVADYAGWYEKEGIKLVEVYATKSKDKNRDYMEAIAGDTTRMQKLVDEFNEYFLKAITQNRKEQLKAEQSEWGTGNMFFAKEAKNIGLIDEISSLDNYIAAIFKEYN
jgi:signal peptide peptidase SppA